MERKNVAGFVWWNKEKIATDENEQSFEEDGTLEVIRWRIFLKHTRRISSRKFNTRKCCHEFSANFQIAGRIRGISI